MILVFTGIQGCGKGTQARLLVEKYSFTLLEMGQILRNIISEKTELGLKIKEIIAEGRLVPPELIEEITRESIMSQTNKNLILDGYARNIGNKLSLEKIVPDYKVVFFDLSKEKAIDRLLGRMYDPETGETFPSNVLVNPKNGNTLVKRKDDNEESILKRIDEFVNFTLPVVELQKQEGKVITINADQSIEEVGKEMVSKLELK